MKREILICTSLLAATVLSCMEGPSAIPSGNGEELTRQVLLDDDTFDDSVTANGRVVMVDFFSPTCSHCIAMTPIVNELADSLGDGALIAKVNVLENDSLVAAFRITGWPTFVFFRNGVEYGRITGETTFAQLREKITTGLESALGKRFAAVPPGS